MAVTRVRPTSGRWFAARRRLHLVGVSLILGIASPIGADTENVYRIVLASFQTEAQAHVFGDDLRARMAQSPEIARAALDSGMWFRVAVGAYDTREAAEAALAVFEQQGLKGWIATEPRDLATALQGQVSAASEAPPAPVGTSEPVLPAKPPAPVEAHDAEATAERLAELAPDANMPATTAARPLGLLPAVRLALERAPLARQREVDRARMSFGTDSYQMPPATLDQVLDADEASSLVRVDELLRNARERGQAGVALDTVLATSAAYLNVCRTEALLEIERKNLRISDSNHERARGRLEPGGANRAELYRWQTTRANAQARVANADAAARRARIELHRTMTEPMSDQYLSTTTTLDEPYFVVTTPTIREAFGSPTARRRLREFFVNEALRGSPELGKLRSGIDARQRRASAANGRLNAPMVAASAGLDRELRRNGAMDEGLGFESVDRTRFSSANDATEWRVGAEASLPIHEGDPRAVDTAQARAELTELTHAYDEAAKTLRAQVLQQTFAVEATFDAMGYARTAAEAGQKNLDRAMAAYDRGSLPVIDVTDMQTATVVAEQDATNALYDFLIDYLRLERLTGQFDLAATATDRDARRAQLEEALR